MLLDSEDKPAAQGSREPRGVQYSKCNTINLSFPKFQKAPIADARIMQRALPKVNHCLPRQNRGCGKSPHRLSPVERGIRARRGGRKNLAARADFHGGVSRRDA